MIFFLKIELSPLLICPLQYTTIPMNTKIENALDEMFQRDEEGNFHLSFLNELEGDQMLALQTEHHDCASGEELMDNYMQDLRLEFATALQNFTKKHDSGNKKSKMAE